MTKILALIIPFIFFGSFAFALFRKVRVYDCFADGVKEDALEVAIPEEILASLPTELHLPIRQVLSGDPRPHYQDDPERIYGFPFAGYEIRFRVEGNVLHVESITKTEADPHE